MATRPGHAQPQTEKVACPRLRQPDAALRSPPSRTRLPDSVAMRPPIVKPRNPVVLEADESPSKKLTRNDEPKDADPNLLPASQRSLAATRAVI